MMRYLIFPLLLITFSCESRSDEPENQPAQGVEGASPGWQQTDLYFGQGMLGDTIPASLWVDFRTNTLQVHMPGFTEISASGFWTSSNDEPLSEPSRKVIYLHEPLAREDSIIKAVISQYKERFHQESVLRVDHTVEVQF